MKILGLDNGYNFTKTSKNVSIVSTITKGIDDINNVIQVEYNGVNYVVGDEKGTYIVDSDKILNEDNIEVLKVTTLTSIGLSYPHLKRIELTLVVGLPIGFYSQQKDRFKELMTSLNEDILINKIGSKQHIKIVDCHVFPQSAGLIFKKGTSVKNERSLVIDIGGGTWDVSEFDGLTLTEKSTYQCGMLMIYSKIANYINSNYNTDLEATDIYSIMKRGWFTGNNKRINIDVIDPLLKALVNKIITKIKRDFHTSSVDNIFLIGGGSPILHGLIREQLPLSELVENAQFINAECFEYMGKLKAMKDNENKK